MPEFDAAQVKRLTAGPSFAEDRSERVCPACNAKAIRTYVSRNASGRRRPSLTTYSWCAACRRRKGWTGPDTGLRFTDPLAGERREPPSAEGGFAGFLRRLDELWAAGELPQRFG